MHLPTIDWGQAPPTTTHWAATRRADGSVRAMWLRDSPLNELGEAPAFDVDLSAHKHCGVARPTGAAP